MEPRKNPNKYLPRPPSYPEKKTRQCYTRKCNIISEYVRFTIYVSRTCPELSSSFKCFSKKLKVKLFNVIRTSSVSLVVSFYLRDAESRSVCVRVCEWAIECVCVSLNVYTIVMCLYEECCVPFHMLPIFKSTGIYYAFPALSRYPVQSTIFLIRWMYAARTKCSKQMLRIVMITVLHKEKCAHKRNSSARESNKM